MNSRLIIALCGFLAIGLAVVKAGDFDSSPESYSEEQFDETTEKDSAAVANDEASKPKPKAVLEDYSTETTTDLAQNDNGDTVALKNKGLCHWGVNVYYKPGLSIRCSCMRCTCRNGGKWDCAYHFAYCPYYYCGNQIYNPLSQICCCGKVHDKKANYSCCGYFYYYKKTSKCCNYYSVKPLKAACPRSKI